METNMSVAEASNEKADVPVSSSERLKNEEQQPKGCPDTISDMPIEYWRIQKIIKMLKIANQTASLLYIVHILDFNLNEEICQKALLEEGGVQILCNLLETRHTECKIGSMRILREICNNEQIHQTMFNMGALHAIVNLLDSPVREMKALAAQILASMTKCYRTRSTVRQCGGIRKLLKLLDCVPHLVNDRRNEKDIEVARCGALALWSCSVIPENQEEIHRAQGIPLLASLLESSHVDLLIPVLGTMWKCASEESYRATIQTEGVIKNLVKHLKNDNNEMQTLSAGIIFKCSEDKQTRDWVRRYNGLERLVSLLDKTDNKELLASAVGAIWKCSLNMENLIHIQEFLSLETLVSLLTDQPEEVLMNVTGAVAEFLQLPTNRAAIRRCGGIKLLISQFSSPSRVMLVNVTKSVGLCAIDEANIAIIDQFRGVRQLWSLLKHPNVAVKASAAWALCPCMENAKELQEMRFIIGGMDLMVNLLKSPDHEVVVSICAVITKLAKHKNNLAVLSDQGIVPLLVKLKNTTDNRLRRHLAEAIGQCSMLARNRAEFGEAVAPLIGYLKSKDRVVQHSAVMALFQLSKNARNCIAMYENGLVTAMMGFMGDDDEVIQDTAASCVRNIRMLARANRMAGRTQAQTSKSP